MLILSIERVWMRSLDFDKQARGGTAFSGTRLPTLAVHLNIDLCKRNRPGTV